VELFLSLILRAIDSSFCLFESAPRRYRRYRAEIKKLLYLPSKRPSGRRSMPVVREHHHTTSDRANHEVANLFRAPSQVI